MTTPSPALPPDAPPTTVADFITNPVFFVFLTGALLLLYLICKKKFDERSATEKSDYVYQLLPSQLATRGTSPPASATKTLVAVDPNELKPT